MINLKKYPKKGELPPRNPLPDDGQYSYTVLAMVFQPKITRIYSAYYDFTEKRWDYSELYDCEVMDFHHDPEWWVGIADEITGEDTSDPEYHRKRMESSGFNLENNLSKYSICSTEAEVCNCGKDGEYFYDWEYFCVDCIKEKCKL